ncbi:MAG: class II fructose-1,6-bisphosphate aldolase [Methanosarcinales archaeon]|jgi:fructose-bisphosphate aldolase class II|nr:class II fructose-1,6-bisphosphate aldolase [Methanosarcinales archaeon]
MLKGEIYIPFVTNKELLDAAQNENYAVGAFNINNMEIAQAIVSTAYELNSPVILAVSQGAIKYAGIEYLSSIAKTAASINKIPISLHLDHGTDFKVILQCIRHGFSSVMIDGSHLPFDENVALTKKVVGVAHPCGVSVEAELGRLVGIEDQISVEEKDAVFTNPDEANLFVEKTNVDSLAIAIGSAHGIYKGEPKLDFDRLKAINEKVKIPLVLHGASGIPDESILKSVKLGINKINIDTELRLAFRDGVKKIVTESDVYDPRKICGAARDAMKNIVKYKIQIFGSENKA